MRTRAAYFGIFTALALILGYVELLIPIHFGIPGAKLGLANLITILVLYKIHIPYINSFPSREHSVDF